MLLIPTLLVNVPGERTFPSMSVVEYWNVKASGVPVTKNLPLYPVLLEPVEFVEDCTFLTTTISPVWISCGSSVKTVTVPELTEQVEMNLGFLL